MARRTVLLVGVVGVCTLLAVSFFVVGWRGPAGVGLGVLASLTSLISLSLMTGMLARTRPSGASGAMFSTTLLIIKLPVLGVCAYLATRLGMRGLFGFLGAVGLVYSCFVWFVVAKPRTL